MTEPLGAPGSRAVGSVPGIGALATAMRSLTVLGARDGLRVDASAVYFPVIGLGLGLLWLAADHLVAPAGGRLAASVAVAGVAALATGGRGLRALGRAVAAVPRPRARRVQLLQAGGTAARVAAALGFVLEIALLATLDRYRTVGLLAAPLLGTCSIVVLAIGSRAARTDGRQVKFAPDLTFREFGAVSAATFALVFLATEFLGLLLVLSVAGFTVAARVGWHRWVGGVDATIVFATAEATQLLVLAVLAALS